MEKEKAPEGLETNNVKADTYLRLSNMLKEILTLDYNKDMGKSEVISLEIKLGTDATAFDFIIAPNTKDNATKLLNVIKVYESTFFNL